MRDSSASAMAEAFLAEAAEYQLGPLPTESPHPETRELSRLAEREPARAIALLLRIEAAAIEKTRARAADIEALAREARATLESGQRVFLCGCGATGRLSLTLETLWREEIEGRPDRAEWRDRIVSFMAGGDYALVRSIENFEDYPEYGARQLQDLGFRDGDLLISCTEGGETPFVIGATEEAARVSRRAPYFLFCNPSETLRKHVSRSRRVLENGAIRKIELAVGPMAICGSTRLQATTALMLATGAALFAGLTGAPCLEAIDEFLDWLRGVDLSGLEPLILAEEDAYRAGDLLLHTSREHAISVLTDLTERSPTFSLQAFENQLLDRDACSWTYLWVPGSLDSAAAWRAILRREPRALDWEGFKSRFGHEIVLGFDFSDAIRDLRRSAAPRAAHHEYRIGRDGGALDFALGPARFRTPRPRSLLSEHLAVKEILNISSTLVMGRLGRYRGNLMLFVKANNKKLIDRAARYAQILLQEHHRHVPYDEIIRALFVERETIGPNDPIVLRTVDHLLRRTPS